MSVTRCERLQVDWYRTGGLMLCAVSALSTLSLFARLILH
jgi:hypothetical protein